MSPDLYEFSTMNLAVRWNMRQAISYGHTRSMKTMNVKLLSRINTLANSMQLRFNPLEGVTILDDVNPKSPLVKFGVFATMEFNRYNRDQVADRRNHADLNPSEEQFDFFDEDYLSDLQEIDTKDDAVHFDEMPSEDMLDLLRYYPYSQNVRLSIRI